MPSFIMLDKEPEKAPQQTGTTAVSMNATLHPSLHYISQTNKGVKSDTMFVCKRSCVIVSKKKPFNRLCTGKSEM